MNKGGHKKLTCYFLCSEIANCCNVLPDSLHVDLNNIEAATAILLEIVASLRNGVIILLFMPTL